MVNIPTQARIKELKNEYEMLRKGKESLLRLLRESELPELVYNSNAIENSTLTLKETEQILLEMETARKVSVRELFEAKNLARVAEYLESKTDLELNEETLLLLHRMLIGVIDDNIAGRFREDGEYVRVGTHIAPAPEHIESLLDSLFAEYASNHNTNFLDSIAKFHLEFERIHPFNDGNGRIGRVLINFQLAKLGYPPVIIRHKSKYMDYYPLFQKFVDNGTYDSMSDSLSLALQESLNKRLAYLRGQKIIRVTEYAKENDLAPNSQLNASKRQTIPAFREKSVWKIGV